MAMMNKIKNKLYNIELIVEDIKKIPQTYQTILQELENDGTCQCILRRKINKLIKDGTVCKTTISCTRFGKAIFYVLPKDYFILMVSSRFGSDVYFFYNYRRDGKFYIIVEILYKLNKNKWTKIKEKRFFEGDILKFI